MRLIGSNNRRKFFRVECSTPICTEVTIVRINNQLVNTGSTKVCVEDIGPGGLKFISKLDLPVNPNFIVKFYTIILEEPLLIEGYIVRKIKLEGGIFQYGVKFIIDEVEAIPIIKLLTELQVKARNGVKLSNCNLCIKNKMECFRLTTANKEKRVYLRFPFPAPVCAELSVKKINNKVINSESDKVCVEDIGQGGLRFLSNLNYPIIDDIIYQIEMTVINQMLLLKGYIVRKSEVEKGIFEYGVKFDITESQRTEISHAIETMRISMNRKVWFKEESFCSKNKIDCLRYRRMSIK